MPLPRQKVGRPVSAAGINLTQEVVEELAGDAVLPRQEARPKEDSRETPASGRVTYVESDRTEVNIAKPILDDDGDEVGTATYAQIKTITFATSSQGWPPIRLEFEDPS